MRETLLTTARFRVERRVSMRAGGRQVTREVVVHPGAVVILPVLDDGRIVMVRNFRPGVDDTLLELPAGTREPGESAEATARRELEEEAGYRAARMEPMTEFYTSPGILTELMCAFLATELTPVSQRLEANEEISVEVSARERVRRLLIDGQLRDGKTIAVLGTYFLRSSAG